MQTRSNGGSSETEVKEFAVMPRGVPSSSRVVITVTPVTKVPKARRRAIGSIRVSVDAAISTMLCLPPYHHVERRLTPPCRAFFHAFIGEKGNPLHRTLGGDGRPQGHPATAS